VDDVRERRRALAFPLSCCRIQRNFRRSTRFRRRISNTSVPAAGAVDGGAAAGTTHCASRWSSRRRRSRTRIPRVTIIIIVVRTLLLEARQQTTLLTEHPELGGHLVLDQREAHRQRRHSEQHVRADGNQLVLVLRLQKTWNLVAETDRRDGYETVVRRRGRVPALPESSDVKLTSSTSTFSHLFWLYTVVLHADQSLPPISATFHCPPPAT